MCNGLITALGHLGVLSNSVFTSKRVTWDLADLGGPFQLHFAERRRFGEVG